MKPFEMIHLTITQKELLRSEPGRVRTWLIRLGLLLFIFLFVLALGETGVRILAPQNLTGTWAVMSPRDYLHNKANGIARHQFLNRVVTY